MMVGEDFDGSAFGDFIESDLHDRDRDPGVPAWYVGEEEGGARTRKRGREGDLLFSIDELSGAGREIKLDDKLAMYQLSRFGTAKHTAAEVFVWRKTDGTGDNLACALNRDGTLLYEVGTTGNDTIKRRTSDGTKLASAILSPVALPTASPRLDDVAIDDDGLVYVVWPGFSTPPGPSHTPAQLIRVDANLGSATTLFTLTDHTGNSTARLGRLTSVEVDIESSSGRIIINGHDDENGDGTADVDTWLLDETGSLIWKKFTGATGNPSFASNRGDVAIEKGGDVYTAGRELFKLARATGAQIYKVNPAGVGTIDRIDVGAGVVAVAGGSNAEGLQLASTGSNIYNQPVGVFPARGTAVRTNH